MTQIERIDSYTVSQLVKDRAKQMLLLMTETPDIFMTERNSIQFEYEDGKEYFELEIFEDDMVLFFISERVGEITMSIEFNKEELARRYENWRNRN
jgi:hypothetical protein